MSRFTTGRLKKGEKTREGEGTIMEPNERQGSERTKERREENINKAYCARRPASFSLQSRLALDEPTLLSVCSFYAKKYMLELVTRLPEMTLIRHASPHSIHKTRAKTTKHAFSYYKPAFSYLPSFHHRALPPHHQSTHQLPQQAAGAHPHSFKPRCCLDVP